MIVELDCSQNGCMLVKTQIGWSLFGTKPLPETVGCLILNSSKRKISRVAEKNHRKAPNCLGCNNFSDNNNNNNRYFRDTPRNE